MQEDWEQSLQPRLSLLFVRLGKEMAGRTDVRVARCPCQPVLLMVLSAHRVFVNLHLSTVSACTNIVNTECNIKYIWPASIN